MKTQGDFDTVRDYVIAYTKLQKSLENGRKRKLQKKITKRSQRQAISAVEEFKQKRELRKSSRVILDSPSALPKPEPQYESTRVTVDSPPALPEAESQYEPGPTEPFPSEKRFYQKYRVDFPLSWPAEGSHLFLDGNNMLYCIRPIRNLVLARKMSQAQGFLRRITRDFAEIMNLENCTLMFDSTKTLVNESRFRFSVVSARPQFQNSDDALVELAKKTKGLFVTSDRELIQRLEFEGVSIWRPWLWFRFVASTLSYGPVDDVDTWDYK